MRGNMETSFAKDLERGQKIEKEILVWVKKKYDDAYLVCLLYTSPSPRDQRGSRMPSSA